MRTALLWASERTLRTLALWLGAFALTLQGMAPLCLAGTGGATAGSSLRSIVICTIHGFERLLVDANGSPVPGAPVPDHESSSCLICVGFHTGGSVVAPSIASVAQPLSGARDAVPAYALPVSDRAAHAPYISRAPPTAPASINA